jgi:hypothetical protein
VNVGATSGVLDTRRPYLVRLPSGANIAVFFYDGGLAHDVAFGGALSNGEAFLKTLEQNVSTPFSGGEPLPTGKTAFAGRLVHLATDGETFGHHHQFADIGLAWILDSAATGRSELALTVYGQWLAQHPPTMEARLHERSSWSCIHGVERWRSNCGCHGGRRSNGSQAWRGPLREALDDLRDHLATVFEREGEGLLHDPWKARDEYVEPLTIPRRDKKFFAEHTIRWHILRRVHRAFELLEMQRHALHMYASCAWFFDDVSDIETLQGMAHAACAIDYSGRARTEIERRFLAILAQVRSNDGDTADTLYRRVVQERRPKRHGVRS